MQERNNIDSILACSNRYFKITSVDLDNVENNLKGNFLILTSYHTDSHGEQFVLKMKKLPNVKVLCEKTLGMLTYKRNQGINYNTPSGKFNLMFTDLKDNWKEC